MFPCNVFEGVQCTIMYDPHTHTHTFRPTILLREGPHVHWPLIHYFSPPLPLIVDRLEERCESFKKDLHNRNIDLVKKHQVLKKESALKRDSRTKLFDEVPAFPLSPNKTARRKDSCPLHRGDAHVLSQQTRVCTCVQCVSE